MRKKLALLVLALMAAAGAYLSPNRAEAAQTCFRYCCPDLPSRCVTCCRPGICPDMNCP
jgi:hypothetical protein